MQHPCSIYLRSLDSWVVFSLNRFIDRSDYGTLFLGRTNFTLNRRFYRSKKDTEMPNRIDPVQCPTRKLFCTNSASYKVTFGSHFLLNSAKCCLRHRHPCWILRYCATESLRQTLLSPYRSVLLLNKIVKVLMVIICY
jgi:hypothetical protein